MAVILVFEILQNIILTKVICFPKSITVHLSWTYKEVAPLLLLPPNLQINHVAIHNYRQSESME